MDLPRSVVAAAVFAACLAHTALAATVNVSPTRVVIAAGASSGAFKLRNLGGSPVSFQIKAFQWTNGPGGDMQLTETDEVIVFPALFVLDSNATRTIRVGVKGAAASMERTYRLLIEELPSRAEAPNEQGIVMRTRLNVPVFAEPRGKRFKATLEPLSLARGAVTVTIDNVGTVHTTPVRYELVGLDAAGRVVWRRDLRAWYVLAGERREQTVTLDADRCRAQTIVAEIELQEQPGTPLRESLSPGPGMCAP